MKLQGRGDHASDVVELTDVGRLDLLQRVSVMVDLFTARRYLHPHRPHTTKRSGVGS